MNKSIIRILAVIVALAVAVPESQAKRMGSGRSAGRQSQMFRRQAPPAAAPAPRRADPEFARQSPPPAPQPAPARQRSGWGGVLGGALVGLGLGSLLSHNADGSAANASGSSDTDDDWSQRAQEEQSGGGGNLLGLGVLALAVIWLVRRARRRKLHDESERTRPGRW